MFDGRQPGALRGIVSVQYKKAQGAHLIQEKSPIYGMILY